MCTGSDERTVAVYVDDTTGLARVVRGSNEP